MLRSYAIASVLAVLLIAASPVGATHTMSRAAIPFDFVVNGQTLPAGTYYFQTGEWKGLMSVYDGGGRRILVPVSPLGAADRLQNPRILFERAGATHRLSEIWFSNGVAGLAQTPRKNPEPATVQVAVQLL
jgi:hypothetical protein